MTGVVTRPRRPGNRSAAPVGPDFVGFSAALGALALTIPIEARSGRAVDPSVIHQIGIIGASLFGATGVLCAHRALTARDRTAGALALILFGPGAVWTWLTFVSGPPPAAVDRVVELVSAAVAIWLLVRGLSRARWVEVYCGLGLIALTGAAGLVPSQPTPGHGHLSEVLLAAVGAMTCLYGTLLEIELAERRSTSELADTRQRLADEAERTEDLLHDLRNGLLAIEAAVAAIEDDTIRPLRMEAARLRRLTAAATHPAPGGAPAGAVDTGPGFDLVPPVRALVELAQARGTAVELRAPAAASVRGCEVELLSVVENLLANAERHGRPPIAIDITASENWTELTVTDHGPGVAPEIAGHLFRRGATNHPDGHGIGLYRARATVARHGGELLCRPGEGGPGTAFVLRLPVPARIGQAEAAAR